MMVNTVGKNYSEANIAYIAGFLDADGAIMAHVEPNRELTLRYRVRITLGLYQNHSDVLEWIYKILETGSITQNSNRALYYWKTQDQNAIKLILTTLLPYLKVKQKQAELALRILNSPISTKNELLFVATLADTLSSLNVRSKNSGKKYVTMIKEHFSRND